MPDILPVLCSLIRVLHPVYEFLDSLVIDHCIIPHGHVTALKAIQKGAIWQLLAHPLHIGRVHGVILRSDDKSGCLDVLEVFWVALIIIFDLLTIDFGRISGSEWFTWIEQVVLHLIVLSGIVQIQI